MPADASYDAVATLERDEFVNFARSTPAPGRERRRRRAAERCARKHVGDISGPGTAVFTMRNQSSSPCGCNAPPRARLSRAARRRRAEPGEVAAGRARSSRPVSTARRQVAGLRGQLEYVVPATGACAFPARYAEERARRVRHRLVGDAPKRSKRRRCVRSREIPALAPYGRVEDCLGLPSSCAMRRWSRSRTPMSCSGATPPQFRTTETTSDRYDATRSPPSSSLQSSVIGFGRRGDGCARTRHAQRPRKLVVRGTIDNDFNKLARREVERQDGIIMKRGDRERRIPYDNELLGAPQAVDKRRRFGASSKFCGVCLFAARAARLVEGRRHEGKRLVVDADGRPEGRVSSALARQVKRDDARVEEGRHV